jgi:hypothetical protein
MSETPIAGWYPDPENSEVLRLWDGGSWTDQRKPVSEVVLAESSDKPESVGGTASKAKKITDTIAASAMAAGGAALVADGAVGIGSQRKGFSGLGKLFIWSGVLLILAIFAFVTGIGQVISGDVSDGSTLPGSLLLFMVAVLLFVIGAVKAVTRAGSVAAGILLVRQGLKKGGSIGESEKQP